MVEEAANADDAATLQTLKTMDSLESKIQNLKNAWQGFYANLGLEEVFKGALDTITAIVNRFNDMPKLFGKIPAAAIVIFANLINIAKTALTMLFSWLIKKYQELEKQSADSLKKGTDEGAKQAKTPIERLGVEIKKIFKKNAAEGIKEGIEQGKTQVVGTQTSFLEGGEKPITVEIEPKGKDIGFLKRILGWQEGDDKKSFWKREGKIIGRYASVAGTAITGAGQLFGDKNAGWRGAFEGVGGLMQAGGAVAQFISGDIIGGISSAVSAISSLHTAWYDLTHVQELQIKAYQEQLAEQKKETIMTRQEVKDYDTIANKLQYLTEHQYDSNEAYSELITYKDSLIDQYPELLAYYDSEGHAVLNMAGFYERYAAAIRKAKQAEKDEAVTAKLIAEAEEKTASKTKATIDGMQVEQITEVANGQTYFTIVTEYFKEGWEDALSEFRAEGTAAIEDGRFYITEDVFRENYSKILQYLDESVDGAQNWLADIITKYHDVFSDPSFFEKYYPAASSEDDINSKMKEEGFDFSNLLNAIFTYYYHGFENATAKAAEARERADLAELSNDLSDFFYTYSLQNILDNNTQSMLFTAFNSNIMAKLAASSGITDVYAYGEEWINAILSLGENNWKALASILEHPEQYATADDMLSAANELFTNIDTEISSPILAYVEQYIRRDLGKTLQDKLLDTQNKNASIIDKILSKNNNAITLGLETIFTSDSLSSIQTRYYDLFSNWLGQINQLYSSDNTNMGDALSLLSISINRALVSGGQDIQNALFSSLLGVDFSDKKSVDNLIAQIQTMIENSTDSNDIAILKNLKGQVQNYSNNIYELLNTQFERITEDYSAAIKSYEDILKDNSNGFTDLSQMNLIASKFKGWKPIGEAADTEDAVFYFDEIEGAYFYTAEALAQLRDKIFGDIEREIESFKTRIKAQSDELSQLALSLDLSDKKFSSEEEFAQFLHEDNKELSKAEEEFYSWLISQTDTYLTVEDALKAYNTYRQNELALAEDAAKNLEKVAYQKAMGSTLQIDKVLSGTITNIETWNENVQAWVGSLELDEETAKQYIDILNKLLNGDPLSTDEFDTAKAILEKLGRENPFDDLMENQIRNAQKQYDILQKLLSAQQGDSIRLTAEEIEVLTKLEIEGIDDGVLETSAENFTGAVQALVQSAIDLYNKGAITLAEQNKAIIQGSIISNPESDFNTNAFQVLASNMGNLTADSLAEITAAFGLDLAGKNFDIASLDGIIYKGGNIIVSDMDAFLESLFKAADSDFKDYVKAHAHDYEITEAMQLEAMSKNVDTLISSETAIIDGAAKELQNLSKAESGKSYNLTYLTHVLGESVTNVLAGALKGAGIATLENGILKINPGQNVVDVLQHITDVITAAGLDDAEIQAAVAEIQDAIVGMLDSIINLFSNGLEGKLSNADKLNLETMAAQYGFTGELTFTETAEGLKLSAESAQELAFHLQKVAGVKGQLVFDAYAKSLQETSSSYKDIFATERTILQLTKDINKANASGDKEKEASLQRQLSLAQQIALVQMSDTDSYAFMDKKLPADFAGPTNYWDSVDKMYSSLAEASKTGYLSTEDFYNMMMAANDMAAKVMEETGEKMTFMGRELDGKALTAAQLIQEGFEHLEHVDGKGLMVSLKGFSVNFAAGAQAMGGDFEKGMKQLAQVQIDLLDGLIGFLETIVAMEQLDSVDSIDKNGILDFDELFQELDNETFFASDSLRTLIEEWQRNTLLWDQFTEIKFSTADGTALKSFDQWLLDAIDEGKMAEADAKRLQTILNTLYQLQKSGDWDMTDIAGTVASMQELLSNTDFEGDIQIGDMHFTVSGGYTIAYELDKEDNPIWTVGNKEFDSWEDAIKQQKLVDFGTKLTEGTFELSEKENFVATYTLGKATIKVDSSSGDVKYLDSNNNSWDDLYSALYADWLSSLTKGNGSVDFDQFLETKGLIRTENGEIQIKGEEIEDPAEKVATAAEGLTTATRENITAVNNLTTAINTLALSTGSNPRAVQAAWNDWQNTYGSDEASWNAFALNYEETSGIISDSSDALTGKMGELQASIDVLNTTIGNQETIISGLQTQIGELQTTNAEQDDRIQQLERALTIYQTGMGQIVAPDKQGEHGVPDRMPRGARDEYALIHEEEVAAAKARLAAQEAQQKADYQEVLDANAEAEAAAAEAAAKAADKAAHDAAEAAAAEVYEADAEADAKTWQAYLSGIQTIMRQLEDEHGAEDADRKKLDDEAAEPIENKEGIEIVAAGEAGRQEIGDEWWQLIMSQQYGPVSQSESTAHPQDELVDAVDAETEAQEDSNAALQKVIEEINTLLAKQGQWQDNSMPDGNTTFDQFLSNNRAPFAMPISIPSDLLQSFYDAFGKKMGLLQTTFEDLNATIEWVNTTTGEACPRIVLLGEAVKESSKNMDKGRKDIQTASTSIRSSLSSAASSLANGLNTIVRDVSNVADSLNNIKINLPQITGSNNTSDAGLGKGNATGSFGNALAAGTLMGELGPELWVSHGHYYVAGQNGAEFVNLPDDAIVFNHLQTQRLLGSGSAGGHGKPVTNERKATSFATGNVNGGPAKASASETLARLNQLKAMWEAIAKMPVSDLGKKAGSGGGGGGGGDKDNKAFIHDLERWFSLEQEILRLEKAITKEQKTRAVLMSDQVINGEKIYASYRREYENLKDRINATQELANLQHSYYEKRQEDLNKSLVSQIFTFDKNGVMKYKGYGDERPGSMGGLDILATLNRTGPNNEPIGPNGQKWDAGGQVDFLTKALAVSKDDLKTSLIKEGAELGEKATDEDILQAWYDLMDSYQSELTELYDSWTTHEDEVLEMQADQNQIIQDIIDNQLSLEQRVLTALIDKAQKAIDDLQDSRDALADANQKYIDGLNDSLQKQRDMYDRNEAANDLNKLQRQLAILQRSGGSASQIRSLQQQIGDQMQDAYFTAQQDQIDAIKEATDKQIERLDYQIDLMTKTLEYQEENGLLWRQVYDKMNNNSPEQLLSFIMDNTASMRGQSTRQTEQDMIEIGDEIGIYKGDLNGVKEGDKEFEKGLSEEDYTIPQSYEDWKALHDKNMEDLKEMYDKMLETEQEIAQASSGSGSGGGSGNGGTNNSNTNTSAQAQTGTLILRYKCEGEWIKPNKTISVKAGVKIYTDKYGSTISGYKFMKAYPSSVTVGAGETATIILYYGRTASPLNTANNNSSGNKANLKDTGFANGGLVDYTGPAQVHGSKSKPESFFDAQSTAILRDDVLGSINVLDSLLADVSTAGTNSLNLGTSESLSIANPVININVDKIANDYDAKRAGQLAFEEMVKIARQSGNRSLSRR